MNDQPERKNQRDLSDELIAGYVEGLLPEQQKRLLRARLAGYGDDRKLLRVQEDVARQQQEEGMSAVPSQVTERAKDLVRASRGENVFDIIIRFSGDVYEALQTNGEILRGPQLQLTGSLRGPGKQKARTLLTRKALDGCVVEVTAVREAGDRNTVLVKVLPQKTRKMMDGLRITLKKDSHELESHPALKGKVVFENVKEGRYVIEIVEARASIGVVSLQMTRL
jgi:hypothetical protein